MRVARWNPAPAAAAALCVLAAGALSAQATRQEPRSHVPDRPRDPEAYMAMLEGRDRDAWQKPEEVVEAICLSGGMAVADIGAGSGYFTRRVAQAVEVVYALDIEKEFLKRIRRDAKRLGLRNVRTVETSPERPDLPDHSVDLVLIVDTWHHIPDRPAYASELRRVLRPGGRVVQLDWKKEEGPVGPPLGHRLDRESVLRDMRAAGFRLRTEHFFLPYQYFLVFDVP